MLTKEVRELIVKACEKGHDMKIVSEFFCVDRSTVSRLVKQMKETGSVELRTSERGRKRSLSDTDLKRLDELIKHRPDSTLEEIRDHLHLTVSIETIRKAIISMGYSYKKKSLHAWERERPRCDEQASGMGRNSIEA